MFVAELARLLIIKHMRLLFFISATLWSSFCHGQLTRIAGSYNPTSNRQLQVASKLFLIQVKDTTIVGHGVLKISTALKRLDINGLVIDKELTIKRSFPLDRNQMRIVPSRTNNYFYLVGRHGNAARIMRFDFDLNQINWSNGRQHLDFPMAFNASNNALDDLNGNLFFPSVNNDGLSVTRLDSNGDEIWSKVVDPSFQLTGASQVVCESSENFCYFFYKSGGAYFLPYHSQKIDVSGNFLWPMRNSVPPSSFEFGRVSIISDQDLVLTVPTVGEIYPLTQVIKHDGSKQWHTPVSSFGNISTPNGTTVTYAHRNVEGETMLFSRAGYIQKLDTKYNFVYLPIRYLTATNSYLPFKNIDENYYYFTNLILANKHHLVKLNRLGEVVNHYLISPTMPATSMLDLYHASNGWVYIEFYDTEMLLRKLDFPDL